jgi:hypothetical protein
MNKTPRENLVKVLLKDSVSQELSGVQSTVVPIDMFSFKDVSARLSSNSNSDAKTLTIYIRKKRHLFS